MASKSEKPAMQTPRVNFYMSLELQRDLKEAAGELGVSVSELVRSVMYNWIEQQFKDGKRTTGATFPESWEELQIITLNQMYDFSGRLLDRVNHLRRKGILPANEPQNARAKKTRTKAPKRTQST